MPRKGEYKAGATKRSIQQREYNSKASSKKDRVGRNAARRRTEKSVGKEALNGKDVDHKDGNPRNNSKGNTRVMSIAKNRSRNN